MTQAARAEARPELEEEPPRAPKTTAAGQRRTVTITGRPDRRRDRMVEIDRRRSAPMTEIDGFRSARMVETQRRRPAPIVEIDRRRPPRTAVERLGGRPDRLAMWAVAMALFLILVTLTSPGG
jgi:hypothetical protein